MKDFIKRDFLCAILASAVMLTACDMFGFGEEAVSASAEVSETASGAENAAETVTETDAEIGTAAEEITEYASGTVSVTEAKDEDDGYAKVSPDNVFIDYEFIEDYQQTEIGQLGTLGAKAVGFLSESDYYAKSHENIALFTDDMFKPYFDEGGNILPKVSAAYPNDYDGDGKQETFLLVDMPYVPYDELDYPTERSFVIFADCEENMTIIDNFSNMNPVVLLDYGDFKQIAFGGFGIMGADEGSVLYGVIGGQAEELYGGRCGFYKSGCFLSTFGWQGSGDFMYYDTIAQEYRAIAPMKEGIVTDLRELDSDNALAGYYDVQDELGGIFYQFIGNRYYIISVSVMDPGTAFVYEDGKFIQTDDCEYVRRSADAKYNRLNMVKDIDIAAAYAEMMTPADAKALGIK